MIEQNLIEKMQSVNEQNEVSFSHSQLSFANCAPFGFPEGSKGHSEAAKALPARTLAQPAANVGTNSSWTAIEGGIS